MTAYAQETMTRPPNWPTVADSLTDHRHPAPLASIEPSPMGVSSFYTTPWDVT
jgi:hypothetical protein